MGDLVSLLWYFKKEQEKYFSRPVLWARKIKKIIKGYFDEAKVYLFGSIIDKSFTPSSDIDVLIVFPSLPSSSFQQKLKGIIYRKIGLASPFELHFVDKKGFLWYKKFIKNKLREI